MTRLPDITERFPEGMGGVDLTDKFFPQEGYIADGGNMEEIQEVTRQVLLEEEIAEVKEKFKVNEETAKEIVSAQRKMNEEVMKITVRTEEEIDKILENNGYETIYDMPF